MFTGTYSRIHDFTQNGVRAESIREVDKLGVIDRGKVLRDMRPDEVGARTQRVRQSRDSVTASVKVKGNQMEALQGVLG